MYGYTAAGLATAKTLRLSLMNGHQTFVHDIELTASYGYNNEGKLTSMGQPGYHTGPPGAAQWTNGEQYTWSYDSMGRLNSVQEISPANASVISGISYNAANQMTQINYGTGQVQTRTYNERLQMTRMTVAGVMDLEYRYSATQNNGQITSMKNYVSGEEVNYTYDSLKRLVSAVTTGPEWGQAYGLDGFGNLLSKTVTTGSAPTWSVAVDGTTNRVVGYGYDANGNTTSIPGFTLSYDVENRLVQAVLGGVETYGYGPDNKRVWRTKASGDTEFYFYGLTGERQGIYRVGVVNGFNGVKGFFRVAAESVIPKGMQADRDRLGSVVSGGLKYDPYGAEFTVTANDRDKFGTYYRDSNTGFNYADQRYYGSSGGRFLTPDPYVASGGAAEPGSWNRYTYTRGDPVNRNDPRGLQDSETGTQLVYCGPLGYVPREYCQFYVASVNQAGVIAADNGPFAQDTARLFDALDTLKSRAEFSADCYRGVARINSNLDPWDIVAASANILSFADATRANLTVGQAYGDLRVGRAAQARENADHAQYLAAHGITDLRVRDYFALHPGTSAYTPYGGNVIYIDAGLLNTGSAQRNQALLMHEILHNEWGLDDGDILDALYGAGARKTRPSADITRWFEQNCVRGRGNN